MLQLPDVNYSYDALEPHVDAETMELHHSKHHASYVKRGNELLAELADGASGPDIGRELAFHISGHRLHSMLWESMSPDAAAPSGALSQAITRDFGSIKALQDQITSTALAVRGSGWAVLQVIPDGNGRLIVTALHDHQDDIVLTGQMLFGVDVWEHAYYVKHRNRRADWLKEFWQVADWAASTAAYEAATASL